MHRTMKEWKKYFTNLYASSQDKIIGQNIVEDTTKENAQEETKRNTHTIINTQVENVTKKLKNHKSGESDYISDERWQK